jgi:hypothetical protein
MDELLPQDEALEAHFEQTEEPIEAPPVAEEPAAEFEAPEAPETPATIEFGDRSYNVEDVRGVIDWVENLTPDQMARVQEALYVQQQPVQQPVPQQPQYGLDPDETLDPRLAQYVEQRFGQVETYLDQLTRATYEQRQLEAARQEAQLADALAEARSGVAERLGLSDDDLSRLTRATEDAGIVAFLAQKNGLGNPRSVFEQALETVYWATPEFREQAMSVTAEQAAEQASTLAQKKARAGSLSSKGATAPRTKSAAPLNPEEAFAAMVNELAKDLAEG